MGNTPAYAGKTMYVRLSADAAGKHPRVCGEDFIAKSLYLPDEETPPRMRGRLTVSDKASIINGNTPAYAGKTFSM